METKIITPHLEISTMLEQAFAAAAHGQPFIVLAFAVAIGALWVALKKAHSSRISALERGLKSCLSQHKKCERRNQQLILAVVASAEGRREEAMSRCQQLLTEPDDEEGI
jgi:hypothetical protein